MTVTDVFGVVIKEGDFVFGSSSTRGYGGELYRVYKLTPTGFSGLQQSYGRIRVSGVMKSPRGFVVIPAEIVPEPLRSNLLREPTYTEAYGSG